MSSGKLRTRIAGAGLQAATEGCQQLQGENGGNPDHVALGSQGMSGEGGLAEEMTPHAAALQGVAAVQPGKKPTVWPPGS
jgi:hypothetical protein